MEDGFELILYILFIVISIVGGLINNYNKKKEELKKQQRKPEFRPVPSPTVSSMPTETETSRPSNPFEEFLRRTLEEYQEPMYQEPIYQEEIPEPEPIIDQPIAQSVKADYKTEGIAAFQSTQKESFSKNIYDQNISLSSEIKGMEEFDYDEIAKSDLSDKVEDTFEFDAHKAVVYSEIIRRQTY